MNKVLIEVCMPAIGEHFDVFVPMDVPIQEVNSLLAEGISEITNGKYTVSKCELLCTKEPAGLLDPSLCLRDYGIKNGTQLYLI